MENLNNSKTIEYDNRVYSEGLWEEVEVILSLHLEGEERFRSFLQKLQESQIEIEPNEEREEVIDKISNLLCLQIYTPETYSFLEFANKYQEYLTDIYLQMKNNNYESELIASNNLLYSYGLYQKYATDEFDEFVKEIKRIGVDISQVRKSLQPNLNLNAGSFIMLTVYVIMKEWVCPIFMVLTIKSGQDHMVTVNYIHKIKSGKLLVLFQQGIRKGGGTTFAN